jgi:hypothetical protein
MRAKRQPEQESIPIPIPIPTPIQAMIGLIGHTFLAVAPEGTNLFGSGWGGIPQRSQRAQRCIGRGKRDLHRSRFQQLP